MPPHIEVQMDAGCAKTPQLRRDQSQVVFGAAHDRVLYVTQHPLSGSPPTRPTSSDRSRTRRHSMLAYVSPIQFEKAQKAEISVHEAGSSLLREPQILETALIGCGLSRSDSSIHSPDDLWWNLEIWLTSLSASRYPQRAVPCLSR